MYSNCFSALMLSSFATLESSGLLFYNGRFNEKHDFIALEIQDGQVVLKYSTGITTLPVCVFKYCWYSCPSRKGDGNANRDHMCLDVFRLSHAPGQLVKHFTHLSSETVKSHLYRSVCALRKLKLSVFPII